MIPRQPTQTGAPSVWGVCAFALLLLVLGGLQSVLAIRLTVWGGSPDFLLTLALCAALVSDAQTGALAGFVCGWMMAALTGETLGTFLISRTLAGWAAGTATTRFFRGNVFVVLAGVFVASLIAELIYAFSAPPRGGFWEWGRGVLIEAVWNALLSLPLTWLLRRTGWGTAR